MIAAPKKPKPQNTRRENLRVRNLLLMAEERGLLEGNRTHIIRGRMPVGLVAEAKRNSGITSDSKLLEAALANLALEDNYWAWMRKHRGTVSPELDLEF
jgi:hypothetical protein